MNILYLCDNKTYLNKLCRARFCCINSLKNLCNIHLSGNGWPDYDTNISVQDNINNMEKKFDIVFVYKPFELKNFKDINIPKCIQYNEMWDIKSTYNEIVQCKIDLIICHHIIDCENYKKMNIPNVKFVYIGHCAEKTVFQNYNLNKEYDILYIGATSWLYPLRQKLLYLIPELKKKYKCHVYPHPGYDLKDAHTNKYQKEMAIAINKSRIVLTCSSRYKYRLGKYVEIPMCGSAAVCGDIPDNIDDYSYVIEINNNMSSSEIINIIDYYLDNEDKRIEKVQCGVEFAKNYTFEHYAERLLKELKEFLE